MNDPPEKPKPETNAKEKAHKIYRLVITLKSSVISEYTIEKASITIGRHADNDVVIHDSTISTHHCRILWDEGIYKVADLKSRNSTFVNGKKERIASLKHEDVIQIGQFKIHFLMTGAALTHPAIPPPKKKRRAEPTGVPEKKPAPKSVKDRLLSAFSRKKPDLKERIKESFFGSKKVEPVPMSRWSSGSFAQTPPPAKAGSSLGDVSYILESAKKRPVLSSIVLMTTLMVLIADLVILLRHFNIHVWTQVAYNEEHGKALWEDRGTGLSYLSRNGQEDMGPLQSALQGTNQLAANLEQPGLPEGLAGIVNPEDGKKKQGTGVQLNADGFDGDAKNMRRTMIAKSDKDDEFLPYQFTGPTRKSKKGKIHSGVYFGDAGDFLDNFADVGMPIKKADGFKSVGEGAFPSLPDGLSGQELIEEVDDGTTLEQLKQYAKQGTWRLRKAPGAKQDTPAIPTDGLANSSAYGQLLEALRDSRHALECGG